MCLFKSSGKVKHLPHCLHLSLSSLPFFRSCSCVCPFRPRCSSFRCRFTSFGSSTPVFERGFALRDVRALLLACETSLSWRLRLLRVGKPFPHFRHEKGFSPVWTNTCLSSVPFFRCCSRVCPFRPRFSSFSCRFVSFVCGAPVFERGFALRDVLALLLACETSLSWRLRLPRVGKVFPQYWHAKVFSPRVWTNMCLFKSSGKAKHLPHSLHLGLSSVPFSRCSSCACKLT